MIDDLQFHLIICSSALYRVFLLKTRWVFSGGGRVFVFYITAQCNNEFKKVSCQNQCTAASATDMKFKILFLRSTSDSDMYREFISSNRKTSYSLEICNHNSL